MRLGLLSAQALRQIDWSWLALDGAMSKAPLGGKKIGPNPTDRGKGGVKRSLLTEAHGIPVTVVIDGATRHDMKLVKHTLDALKLDRPGLTVVWPQGLCLDKGYDYDEVRVWCGPLDLPRIFVPAVRRRNRFDVRLDAGHGAGWSSAHTVG